VVGSGCWLAVLWLMVVLVGSVVVGNVVVDGGCGRQCCG